MQYVFRAMTFNVRRDTRSDGFNRWYFRRGYAANEIVRISPDIVGVQELMPHMKDYLADALDGYSFFGRGRGRLNDNEHSDILLKKSSIINEDSHTFWLSSKPDYAGSRLLFTLLPRICTASKVRIKGADRSIYVLNTHFDFISRRARMVEANIICSFIKDLTELERLPLILMGDFNARENSASIKRLCDNGIIPLRTVYEGDMGTLHLFRGRENGMRCDHMLISEEFEVVKAFIDTTSYNGRYPSDHFPLIADLGIEAVDHASEEE